MNFYGAHFEYAGRSSEDYGLIIASINESQNMAVSGSAELITLFNKRDNRRYYIDTNFDGAHLEYNMEVFSEDPLSVSDQRSITKWLFHQRGFRKLYVRNGEKNFVQFPYAEANKTSNNASFVIGDDGGITVNTSGAASAATYFYVTNTSSSLNLPVGTYTVSGCPSGGSGSTYRLQVGYYNDNNSWVNYAYDNGNGATFNVTEESRNYNTVVRIFIANGSTVSDLVFYPQIECGTSSTSFTLSKRVFLNCIFTDPEKIEGADGVHGYKFKANCDSATGWMEAVSQTFNINGSDNNSSTIISVTTDTDTHEYVYPVVQINMGTGGDCTIVNNTDSNTRMTTFKELAAGTTLRMNGNTNFITSGYYSKFYDRNFVRLLDGVNNLVVYGPVESITLEWENRSYV